MNLIGAIWILGSLLPGFALIVAASSFIRQRDKPGVPLFIGFLMSMGIYLCTFGTLLQIAATNPERNNLVLLSVWLVTFIPQTLMTLLFCGNVFGQIKDEELIKIIKKYWPVKEKA